MDFKFSRYNHAIRNKHNELLLYNSFTNNLYKFREVPANLIEPMMISGTRVSGLTEKQINVLFKTGIIVPYEEEESIKLKIRFEEIVNNGCLALTLLPTEQCNYRCGYCNQPFVKRTMSLETQQSLIQYIRRAIHNYNRLDVSWFGGEPLLAADIIESMSERFMQITHTYRVPFTANITTNGYLLTENMMRRMLHCNVTSFQVTIDGLEDTHNRQKPLAGGGKTYRTVLNNLRGIRDHINTKMFRIIIRTNITKEVYEHFDEYLDFYSKEFNDDNRFSFFFRPAMDWGGGAIDSMRDQLVDDNVIENVYQKLISSEKLKRFDAHRGFFTAGGTVCAAAKMNFYTIESDGKVHKCSQMFDDDFDTTIGYIDSNGTMQVDTYKQAQWLLERSVCDVKDCYFGGNCLSEFCPKLRIIGNCGRSCPHEKANIDLVMQVLDLDEENYTMLDI